MTPSFLDQLRTALRGKVHADLLTRGLYATDASHYQQIPTAVAIPQDEADLLAALRVAHAHGVPVTPRGAASALSGQTFGPGLVLDLGRLNHILEINPQKATARVQPGVVCDHLNAATEDHGLHFAPDPATGSRATFGGMIGNNSSGTRSVVYGKTIDHVVSCRVALADGTVARFDNAPLPATHATHDPEAAVAARLYAALQPVIQANRNAIVKRFPKVMRRVSGYNLDAFVPGAGHGWFYQNNPAMPPLAPHNLTPLIVGSEGTLGVLLEATVRLVPAPQAAALAIVHFDDDLAALRAVPQILTHHPSAVELLDRRVLREAATNPATRAMAGWVKQDPAAVLIVEFCDRFLTPENPANPADPANPTQQVAQHTQRFATTIANTPGVTHCSVITCPKRQRDVWETRKLGLGLISNVQGPVKGQAFVEDACVPVNQLADYIAGLQAACRERGVDYALYAHASVGVIHFRPELNLQRPEHVTFMRDIAEHAFVDVVARGGAFAGEHGDGVVRGVFIPRFFGPDVYAAFKQVKTLFDPDHLMNPGKIVDAPAMDDPTLLRYGPHYRVAEVFSQNDSTPHPTAFRHDAQGGFAAAVEQCNGVGACLKIGSGTMCPSYMATRQESHGVRGRANALRLAMSGQLGSDAAQSLASNELHDVLDHCLSCKACKAECPNAVDVAKLKADVQQLRHDRHGVSRQAKFIGSMPDHASKVSGFFAQPAAWLSQLGFVRALMQKRWGIDRRRPLPAMSSRPLRERHLPKPNPAAPRGPVVLFDDTYTRHFEPHLAQHAATLLTQLGYAVHLANAGCCQRPRLSQGLLRDAAAHGAKTLAKLDALNVGNPNAPILCLEPSCASALKDDLPDLVSDQALAQRVADRVQLIDAFLANTGRVTLKPEHANPLVHNHCHQKAVFDTNPQVDHLTAPACDAGCCGMAGAFGYTHFDLSQTIAQDRLLPLARDAHQARRTLIANGISCRHQLSDLADIKAKHFVEVVEVCEGREGAK